LTISQEFLKKEDLRVRLFGDTWRTVIPEVFRDVPAYYDKGNAVASLGNCSRWSNTFAAAIRRHVPPGSKVLDVCSGLHDIRSGFWRTTPRWRFTPSTVVLT